MCCIALVVFQNAGESDFGDGVVGTFVLCPSESGRVLFMRGACEILNCSIFIDVDCLKRFIIILFGNFHIIYADHDLNILQVAMTHPMAVTNCNIDMESLISDQNRSIATLAITTLLKTGNESSVDRLMKQITNFMSDIADEFKIVVVEAIRSLCLKFPLKYRSL